MPRRAVCGSIRAAPTARGLVGSGAVRLAISLRISCLTKSEGYSHLRADDDRVFDIARTAGIDDPLQVGLKVTPLRELKAMGELEHLFRFRPVQRVCANV